jgi:hypothetical protein
MICIQTMDVPDDIFSESDTASGSDKEGVNVKVAPKEMSMSIPQDYSKQNTYIRPVYRKCRGETNSVAPNTSV